MERKYFISFFVFLVVLSSACSPSALFESDPSFSVGNYRTYAWVDTRETRNSTTVSPTEFARLVVQNAANEQLQQKGWRLVTDEPDALLSYDILIERNVEQRRDPVLSRSVTRVYYNRYLNRWSTIYYPQQFIGYNTSNVPVKKATLSINVTDAKTDKLIWQGWTSQTVSSIRLSQDEMRSSVKSILRKFK